MSRLPAAKQDSGGVWDLLGQQAPQRLRAPSKAPTLLQMGNLLCIKSLVWSGVAWQITAHPCHVCLQLEKALKEQEKGEKNHRLFYLALPPSVYPQVSPESRPGKTGYCSKQRPDLPCLSPSEYPPGELLFQAMLCELASGVPERTLADVNCTQPLSTTPGELC